MNIKLKKQSQFELFPGASQDSNSPQKRSGLTKDLTLSLENIIVLSIVFVMALVLFFSFGVERGKKAVLMVDSTDQIREESRPSGKEQAKAQPAANAAVSEGERVVFPIDPRAVSQEPAAEVPEPLEKQDEQENLFTIQVASFKTEASALREADRIKSMGHEDTFVLPKGDYSIVCVGKFILRDEAKRFSGRLKNQYNDCLVRRL